MMATGFTEHRLGEIRTYSRNDPYQVGINGVTNIQVDTNGDIIEISYILDNINYVTTFDEPLTTIFDYVPADCDTEPYFNFKEESKLGLVFTPKVDAQVFIERNNVRVFEPHSRLRGIGNLDSLINYNNGYYDVKDTI